MNPLPATADVPAERDFEGGAGPLLRAMLSHLSAFRHTPLRFGIDSTGIVNAALLEIHGRRIDEPGPALHDWEAIKAGFEALLAGALRDERHLKVAPKGQLPGERFALSERGGHGVSRSADRKPAERAMHPLVAWLEGFHAALRGVHPDAIEIVRLRMDDCTSREIAERLALGLRLVGRIMEDTRRTLAGGANP